MKKNAIIVHGKPSEERYFSPEGLDPSDSHWIPWAKHQLNVAGIQTSTPYMPLPFRPDYDLWAAEFERYDVTSETTLVGLSAGAGFLVEWLSQHNQATIDKLVLVAPWVNPNKKYENFFSTEIDRRLTERCLGGAAIFHSSEDDLQARTSFEVLQEAWPAVTSVDIPRYGHFMLGNMMRDHRFPELIEHILAEN